MLLTLRLTQAPATDLGYLLHKNPARVQSFDAAFGQVHVFYREVTTEACTAALMLDVDPVALVRGRKGSGGEAGPLAQYVNDRPYVASSFLSVALSQVLRSAMAGQSKDRPELAAAGLPLEARLAVVPCRGGESLLRRLFEPLGYAVTVETHALDAANPDWGASPYVTLTLNATCRLSELLTHLYVLVPVLDDDKHYFVGDDEVEKLLRHGQGWLNTHPARALITRRYLKHQRGLVRDAVARLMADEGPVDETDDTLAPADEPGLESPTRLADQRLSAVVAELKHAGARRVLDLGCGEGALLQLLLADPTFEEIVGVDVSWRALEKAGRRLGLARLAAPASDRIRLLQGSLVYRDTRLTGFDAACVVEVIEHLDPARLAAFERTVFELARPGTVVLTTPNAEYNVLWPALAAGGFRHRDHRFEWTRAELRDWATVVGARFGYAPRFASVGEDHPEFGPPTQMAVFTREGAA